MNKKSEKRIMVWLIIFAILSVLLLALWPQNKARGAVQKSQKTQWQIDPGSTKQLIRVSIKTQRLYFFQDGRLIHTFLCSTSRGPIEPRNVHPRKPHDHVGIFIIDYKQRNHWSKEFKVDMPYALHFWHGHFIHQSSVVSRLGHPASHGCVRLSHKSAKWLYSQVKVGTKVEIR